MIGSSSNLCAIGAAVYLSLLGPKGLQDLGESIIAKASYAMRQIDGIPTIKAPVLTGSHFKEFQVNFDDCGKAVAEVNKELYQDYGIIGGKDLSREYPQLGQTALFCVTEVHSTEDIHRLVQALREIAERR